MQSSEQIARQFANAAGNRRTWENILFNVMEYGSKGDGVTDDTTAIQQAIDAASVVGGTVYLPPTETGYVINSGLILRPFVHLTGNMMFVGDKSNNNARDTKAATIQVKGGSGSESGTPAIEIRNGCQISNIKFYYPNQVDSSSPVQYPPTIKLANNFANDVVLENLFFTNSWIAIDASGGHERLTVQRVKGQPLSIGIKIDNNFDVDRITDVHFYPYWSPNLSISTSAAAYVSQNAKGFEIKRADGIQLSRIFVYGYKYGLHLAFGSVGGSYGSLNTGGFDFCHRSIIADSQGINGTAGWSISDVQIAVANQYLTNAYGINTLGSTNGNLRVSNSSFWRGTNGQLCAVLNSGDIMYSNCHFKAWAAGSPAIYLDNAAGLQVNNCLFDPPPGGGGVHITVAPAVTVNPIITSTRFKGGASISNGSAATVVTAGNS